MKFAACLFLVTVAATSLRAQTFLPAMPPGVPEVTGDVQEAAVYIEIVKGVGAPAKPGQRYIAHYTGWLRDGTKFDSSVDRKQPFDFVQGRRMVIAGWEMGFEGMNAGGKRRLFVPYQLAYGEKGNGPIPPKAELIFDIELLESKDVPEYVAAADILDPFDEYRDKVLALASAIPAEKYGWRPAPDVRSVAEVLTHIALGVKLMNDLGIQEPAKEALEKRQADMPAMEKQLLQRRRHLPAGRRGTRARDLRPDDRWPLIRGLPRAEKKSADSRLILSGWCLIISRCSEFLSVLSV